MLWVQVPPGAPTINGVREYDNAKRKQIRHRRIIKHFTGFIDRRWYPDFQSTKEVEDIFRDYQSYGRKKLTEEQLKKIEPLLNGQVMYELTIKMIVEEMCDWWCNNWGWYYPLQSTIDYIKDDRIFKVSLLRIKKRCMEEHGLGFVDFINSFTGLSQEQKNKYFSRKFG